MDVELDLLICSTGPCRAAACTVLEQENEEVRGEEVDLSSSV